MDYLQFDAPLGAMTVLARGDSIVGACFADHPNAAPPADARINAQSPLLQQARDEPLGYFDARRRRFGLPLAPAGTEFQRAVWAAIALIEPGRTVSYAELALMLGREDAVRAVAQAVARNPLMILVPCHRVVGSGGQLTGFSAGLERKQRLLALEGAVAGKSPSVPAAADYCI